MIEFLGENLAGPELSPLTRKAVAQSAARGKTEETADGWPYLALDDAQSFPLDGPLGYDVLEQLADERNSSIVVFGLGLGHAVRAIRGTGSRIAFVFEPDPGLLRHYLEAGPSDLGGIRVVTDLNELTDDWARLIGPGGRVHLIDTPGYSQVFAESRRALVDRITRMLERSVVNEATFRARGRAWISDIIENAPYMEVAPSALHLQGAFRGVPAFIVGAGPSLSKNVELLRDGAKKGIVFASNTSAGALDRAGITPQILGCIESIDLSRFLTDLSFLDQTVRVLSFTSHPNHFRASGGPILSVHELLPQVAPPFEALYGRSALPVSGSVSTALVALALRLGCSPIVLVGQDLAFTGGEAYSKGTVFEDSRIAVAPDGSSIVHERCEAKLSTQLAKEQLTEKVEWVTAWGGGESVPSTTNFGHVRTWLERFAAVLRRAEFPPELVNATEGGSHISGFAEKTLAATLAGLPDREITPESIFELAQDKGSCPSREDVCEFFRNQATGARSVARAAHAVESASSTVRSAWSRNTATQTVDQMRALDVAERELRARMAEFPWVDVWAWAEVDRTTEGPTRGSTDVLSGIEREGRFGAAIARAADELASRLEERVRSLATRSVA